MKSDTVWLLLWPLLLLLLTIVEGKVVVISAQNSITELRVNSELLLQDEEVVEVTEIKCIHEKGLDFTQLDLVSTKELEDNTLASCVTHCLTDHPYRSHILISYEKRAVVSDGFICICADEEAFYNRTEVLSEGKCDKRCPDNDEYRCGDAGDDVLSVYCLKRECLPEEERSVPVCAVRMPHDPHGCIASAEVSWAHAHNVRNFSADVNDDTACVWECHDHHPSSMYSLTRVDADVLTCSCAYPRAFAPNSMVQMEFCDMLPEESPFYRVNCITDLDEDADGGSLQNNETCRSLLPMGCVFEDFLMNSNLTSAIAVSSPDGISDPQLCHATCYSVYGDAASHVGVRWDEDDKIMHCMCLKPGAVEEDMVGPEVACNVPCEPEGTGLMCGGPANETITHPPAMSIYCLHKGLKESVEDPNEDEDDVLTLYGSESILQKLHRSMRSENVIGDVMVGLLTFLCIILISIVVYLCVSGGIMGLSRQAM